MTTVLDLGGQVAEAVRHYVERNPESRRLHEERAQFMPGGNTRTVIHVDPFPLTVVRGDGARIVDADGHEYLDFLGEYTAGLYGHSHPAIVQAIRDALADGIVLGAPNVYEGGLAAAVCERFPSIELVRFCNSGTEANLLALSLTRVASRKPAVMVFEGAYHGGVFFFKDGDAPLNAPFRYLVGRYNDPEAAARQIAEHAHELAAVIVEPVQGSGGVIPGEPEFLHALREAAPAAERLRNRTRPRLLRDRSRLDGGIALHAGPGAAHGRLARGAGAAHAPAPAHARSWLLVRAAWVRRPVVAADSERRRRVRVRHGGVSPPPTARSRICK